MKKSVIGPMMWVITSIISNCVHVQPLTSSEVQSLTTCRDSSLETIRKTLMLSGYEIKSKTSTNLVTEYKQVGGHNGYRTFRRISVVQEAPKVYRFAVREKSIEIESDQPNKDLYGNPTPTTPAAPATVVNVNLGNRQRREFENEFDPSYDVNTLAKHQGIKAEVCGG